jgi:hypothetical protein
MSDNESVVTENMVVANSANPPVVTNDKIEQFRSAVDELKLKTGRTRLDLAQQVVGGVFMLGGLIAGLVIYEQSLSQSSSLNLASEQILMLVMLGVIVIGAALFASASLTRFLRFWMLRNLYEGQAHIDRLVDTYEAGSRT